MTTTIEKPLVKERPILFSGELVRAIRADKKTQTRRIIKPQPRLNDDGFWFGRPNASFLRQSGSDTYTDEQLIRAAARLCPYGAPGDRLWVRETWCPRSGGMLAMDRICRPRYRASEELRPEWGFKWRSPACMPRWASRITLEITGVRAQWLEDISEQDAKAEGVTLDPCTHPDCQSGLTACSADSYRGAYAVLWNKINGDTFPWGSKPWVWVVTFKQL